MAVSEFATFDFGPLSEQLGYLLHRVDAIAMHRMSVALSELGVTPARATAVVYVALHEGCDQIALGRALGINRASTMKAVNELVALGAVERRAGRDRRSNALHLTARGAQMREEIERITGEVNAMNFSGLSAEEQRVLRGLLTTLKEAGQGKGAVQPIKQPTIRRVK